MLARALTRPSNLLVLDEPTNDLDLDTLELLQELLADYAGTLLLVSHDRDFLDRVATSLLVYEGKGRWQEYAGGYSDMLAQRGKGVEPLEREPLPLPPERERVGVRGAARSDSPARLRLSPSERHALTELPRRMETLQKGIAGLAAKLALPSFHSDDSAAAAKAAADLAKLQAALHAAEDEWLRLSLLQEEIEG
jgi:ATP-binding cassette subfamily F protein uup